MSTGKPPGVPPFFFCIILPAITFNHQDSTLLDSCLHVFNSCLTFWNHGYTLLCFKKKFDNCKKLCYNVIIMKRDIVQTKVIPLFIRTRTSTNPSIATGTFYHFAVMDATFEVSSSYLNRSAKLFFNTRKSAKWCLTSQKPVCWPTKWTFTSQMPFCKKIILLPKRSLSSQNHTA